MATARASGMLNGREAEALDRLTRSVVDLGRLAERYFAPVTTATFPSPRDGHHDSW